jgi:hypothetical protein
MHASRIEDKYEPDHYQSVIATGELILLSAREIAKRTVGRGENARIA